MPAKKNEKELTADKTYGVWVCPECKASVKWTYSDMADAGNPICNSPCDTEMEFTGEMGIN
jgi:hypothetical protein